MPSEDLHGAVAIGELSRRDPTAQETLVHTKSRKGHKGPKAGRLDEFPVCRRQVEGFTMKRLSTRQDFNVIYQQAASAPTGDPEGYLPGKSDTVGK